MKKILSIFAALLLSINLVGCQKIGNSASIADSIEAINYPVEVGQAVFDSAPSKVASLSPALTEIICDLGYQASIVARSSYCDYPADIASVVDIGSSANPNIDQIITLAPELLISQSPIAKRDITKIENAGIRVLILSTPQSYGELKQCYIDIAELFGGSIKAEESAEKALIPLTDALDKALTVGTFAYIVTSDLAVATGDTLSADILSYFGENIAKENQKYTITTEELLTKQPDVIFLASPITAAELPADMAGLTAIVNGQIISVDNTCFERPTARLLAQLVTSISTALTPAATTAETEASTETTAEKNSNAQ